MSETRGAEARLKIVDEHIAHEVAHRLEPLVGTFGDEPEWHNMPGGNVMHGHAAIRDFYAALFEGFPDFDIDVRQKHVASVAVSSRPIFEGHTAAPGWGWLRRERPSECPSAPCSRLGRTIA